MQYPKKFTAEFQKKNFEKQKELESKLNFSAFLDRGTVDILAFYKMHGLTPSEELKKYTEENKYDAVFFLEQLPFYEQNEIRKAYAEKYANFPEILQETYKNLDYTLIKVPYMSVEKRVEFILNKLNEIKERSVMNKEVEIKIQITSEQLNILQQWLNDNAKFIEQIDHKEYYLDNPNDSFFFINSQGKKEALRFFK